MDRGRELQRSKERENTVKSNNQTINHPRHWQWHDHRRCRSRRRDCFAQGYLYYSYRETSDLRSEGHRSIIRHIHPKDL